MSIILSNFLPSASETSALLLLQSYANPGFTVSFDITSDGNPIDPLKINVSFAAAGGLHAISSGVPQDGYNVSVAETDVGLYSGYHIEITPSMLHKTNTVCIKIDVDTSPSSGFTTFYRFFATASHLGIIVQNSPLSSEGIGTASSEGIGFTFSGQNNNVLFQLNNINEPVITNRIPVVNSTDSSPTTNIQFSLHDSGQEGVNVSTIKAWINGDLAVDGGSYVYPYTGTTTSTVIDGFDATTIDINPASNFAFSQVITIRVQADDLIADPTAVNTLDTTYQFTTQSYTDITAPTASPTQPPTGLGLDACVEFDWLDEPQGLGPDWDTLDVTLRRELTVDCITSIRDDIAVVDGLAAPGYAVYATVLTVGLQVGFHVIVCSDTPFNELEIITVIITGDDLTGSSSTSTFEISTLELTSPTILNMNPAQDDTDVDPSSSVYFEMHDSAGVGVDVDRVSVNIDDSEAVINGAAQPGFTLSIVNDRIIDQFSLDFDGYEFTITRDLPFTPGKHISVEIDGYDGYDNRAVPVSYDFVIAQDITPPTITFSPESGATGLNRDQNITVEVRDSVGVDRYKTDIVVQGNPAVLNGVAVAPFDVYISEISTVPGFVDGYRYLIDTEIDFLFNQLVEVNATAEDLYNNSTASSMTFTTFLDTTGPAITNISPRDGQREVSLTPEIAFTMRDGYDIAFELTYVTVNGEKALKNGLVQSGYSLATNRISGGVAGVDPGDGYNVYLTRTEGFSYNQTVEVDISAYDRSANNLTNEVITWYPIAPEVPLFDVIPSSGSEDVAIDTNFVAEIFSDGYGIDKDTIYFAVDGNRMVRSGIVQGPNYLGTVTELTPDEHYRIEIDARYLLTANDRHSIYISAREKTADGYGVLDFTFRTGNRPYNPETLYIGGSSGVLSVASGEIDGYTEPTYIVDGYYVNDLSSEILNEINKLAVATRARGVFLMSTNYAWPNFFYSYGDDIVKVHLSTRNNGTLYLANRTKRRVDVYYDILSDNYDRSVPDVYYNSVDPAEDGYAVPGLIDGYFTDMVVTEETSSITEGSSTIFLATAYGVFKIETDESVLGVTEINGELTSYGVVDSGYDNDVLGGNTNNVVAIDVNTRLNHLYVATRSIEEDDISTVTYVDLTNNTRSGVIQESELMHKIVNDLDFQD